MEGKNFDSKWQYRQLFIDDYDIERMHCLERVVNPVHKYERNPVLKGEEPWCWRAQVYGTAMLDPTDSRFKLWYLAIPGLPNPPMIDGRLRVPHTTLVAYATSEDGIHWEKPNLGQVNFEGSKKNNLLAVGRDNREGITVLLDQRASDPNRRYKAFFWEHAIFMDNPSKYIYPELGDGMWVAFSPDGVHWTNYEGNPVMNVHSDTGQCAVWDPKLSKFVMYGRLGHGRVVARSESEDFIHWSQPQIVLTGHPGDGENPQLYGIGVDIYEGLYIGMVWVYPESGDYTIDVEIACSRDGIHWQRVGLGQKFIPNGPPGSPDAGMIFTVNRPVLYKEKLYIYYSGMLGDHYKPAGVTHDREWSLKYRKMDINLGLLRRDGFVSLDAGAEEGYLLTKPFILPEGELHLNVDATGGEVRVEITDEGGRQPKELSLQNLNCSESITGDNLSVPVKWKNANLAEIAGQMVRLRFLARNAKLYSYWFE